MLETQQKLENNSFLARSTSIDSLPNYHSVLPYHELPKVRGQTFYFFFFWGGGGVIWYVHDFIFLGVCACRIFFSVSNILHEIYLVDRLIKRHPV